MPAVTMCKLHAPQIAACYAALGVANDPFSRVWKKAAGHERRMFLKLARLPVHLDAREWDELSAESRGAIKTRAADMRDWLVKALGGEGVK